MVPCIGNDLFFWAPSTGETPDKLHILDLVRVGTAFLWWVSI